MPCVLGSVAHYIQATLAHTHNLARIHNTQVPEAGSAGNDGDMLNQHVSLLASLAPVVRETIHPDGTRQAATPHTPLIRLHMPTLAPSRNPNITPHLIRAQEYLSPEVLCGCTLDESDVQIADIMEVKTSQENKLIWKYTMCATPLIYCDAPL